MNEHTINLISGPRNISTALMYSFGNRADCGISDEPFYGYYLKSHPEILHPGRAETLRSMPTKLEDIHLKLDQEKRQHKLFFIKNMAHHMDGLDWSYRLDLKNIFLVREPKRLITSFAKVIPHPTLLDIGLQLEYDIFNYLKKQGQSPVVVDSATILNTPEKALSKLCAMLDIEFDRNMLEWEAGPRPEDGTWAKYWYKNVHQSTGFNPQTSSKDPFPEYLQPLLDQANKYYRLLCEHKMTI